MFYLDALALGSRHKLSVWMLFLAKLSAIQPQDEIELYERRQLYKEMQIFFFNHEQKLKILSFLCKQSLKQLRGKVSPLTDFLNDVILSIEVKNLSKHFSISPSDVKTADLECLIARRFESHMAVEILGNPGEAIWDVVNKVSTDILKQISLHIKQLSSDKECELLDRLYDSYQHFFKDLGPSSKKKDHPHLALAFARFDKRPDFLAIIDTLKEGRDLARVMLIHFMFMRDVYSKLPWSKEMDEAVLRAEANGDFKTFLKDYPQADARVFFCRYTHPEIAPHLYTDRGRVRFIPYTSYRLGLMLEEADAAGLPIRDTAWCPDTLCNIPDLSSPYVRSLLSHDIPYIAGPSGMTSILSGAMTFLGELSTKEKKVYSLAIMAFIVGGGLHSIHEVLTIPTVRLGLFDNYVVSGEGLGNYFDFFNDFKQQVPEVPLALNNAWLKTLQWFKANYSPLCGVDNYQQQTEKYPPQAKEIVSMTRSKSFS